MVIVVIYCRMQNLGEWIQETTWLYTRAHACTHMHTPVTQEDVAHLHTWSTNYTSSTVVSSGDILNKKNSFADMFIILLFITMNIEKQ